MKNKQSYKSKFKAWFIALIILFVAGTVSTAVICQTQINEIISISQSEEEKDNTASERLEGESKHEKEDFEITQYITPLTTIRIAALAVIAGAWVGMVVWYWLLVAFWMKNRTANAGYNSRLWFIFTLLTNIIAVAVYEILRRIPSVCPYCFHINMGGSYCSRCGSRLFKTCPGCGQRLNRNTKYCPNCGKKS